MALTLKNNNNKKVPGCEIFSSPLQTYGYRNNGTTKVRTTEIVVRLVAYPRRREAEY